MDFAKGTDLNHMDENDPSLISDIPIVGGKGLKSVADLQVIDYICANTDRHEGNMLYQFNKKGEFQGVVGIDNDLSFGTVKKGQFRYGAEPHQFKVMSSEMAKKITEITPEMLRLSLGGYGLDRKEIEATEERLNNVKEAVTESRKTILENKNKQPKDRTKPIFNIIEDNEWNNVKLKDLSVKLKENPEGGVFRALNTANARINFNRSCFKAQKEITDDFASDRKLVDEVKKIPFENEKKRRDAIKFAMDNFENNKKASIALAAHAPKKDFVFSKGESGLSYATEDYKSLSNKMSMLLTELKEANKGIFIGSKEYDNMMSYADYMNKEFRSMAFGEKPQNMTEEAYDKKNYDRTKVMLGTMKDVVAMYARRDKAATKLSSSEIAKKRGLAAVNILNFVDSNMLKFNVTFDKLYCAGMQNEIQNAVNRMSAKEVGKKIDAIKKAKTAEQKEKSQKAMNEYFEEKKRPKQKTEQKKKKEYLIK